MTILSGDVAVQPGYIRLVLRKEAGVPHSRAACRKFAELCRAESCGRGLILAQSSYGATADLEEPLALATGAVFPGFRLAVVARGSGSAHLTRIVTSMAARHKATTKHFSSEHQAAGWLMG